MAHMEHLAQMEHFAPEPENVDPAVRNDRRFIRILFLAALLLRFAFAFDGLFNDESMTRFQRPDTESYLAPAHSMVAGGDYRGVEGTLTAHRTPGLPLFFAAASVFGEELFFSVLLILLGCVAVFPIYGMCRKFAPPLPSFFAAGLFVLNPTAIGNAPLLLSDTLFLVFTAFMLRFMVEFLFEEKHDPAMLIFAAVFAGLGTLIRPLNLLWFVPCCVMIFCVRDGRSARQKVILSLIACGVFFAFILPWVIRNHAIGAGWRLDTSSAVTMTFNAATLESSITGKNIDDLREGYMRELASEIDPEHDSQESRLTRCEKKMTAIILKHPIRYAALSLRPWVLLPDVPTLLENLNVTQGGQGTFDVLNHEGIFAAAAHYFKGRELALILMIPLILITFVLYGAVLTGLWRVIRRKDYLLLFLLIGFGFYYLWITGPVTMPRYVLPALPVFCIFAAIAFTKKDALLPSQPEK